MFTSDKRQQKQRLTLSGISAVLLDPKYRFRVDNEVQALAICIARRNPEEGVVSTEILILHEN